MQKFDRIFDRENMVVTLIIDVINHARKGCRLAGARGARYQHQTTRHLRKLLNHVGHAKVFQGQDL